MGSRDTGRLVHYGAFGFYFWAYTPSSLPCATLGFIIGLFCGTGFEAEKMVDKFYLIFD